LHFKDYQALKNVADSRLQPRISKIQNLCRQGRKRFLPAARIFLIAQNNKAILLEFSDN